MRPENVPRNPLQISADLVARIMTKAMQDENRIISIAATLSEKGANMLGRLNGSGDTDFVKKMVL